MKHKVILTEPYLREGLAALSESCEIVLCRVGDEEDTINEVGAIGAIIGAKWQVTGKVLDRVPSLQVIGRPGIGVDNIDIDAATERGVAVVNTPDAPTVSTAEQTVSLILALAKRHRPAIRLLNTQTSPQTEANLIEVRGKVLGLIGLGRIGGEVARICRLGLGMNVMAYDPYVAPERFADLGVTMCSTLDDVLGVADFVSLHIPPTNETRGMITTETLAPMKPSAFLINCARGAIVDEAALIEALRAGKIAGAGLDVFDPEPPSPSNPLLAMENVVATPHSSGFTPECLKNMAGQTAVEILDFVQGKRPANLVIPQVWDSRAMQQRKEEGPQLN